LFDQVRQGVLPDEALAEIQRDPTSLRALMAYGEAALAAGTLLSRGGGGERITAAALRGKSGEIRTGVTHGHIEKEGLGFTGDQNDVGFVTDKGRYLTQEEAANLSGGAAGAERMASYLKDPAAFNEEVQSWQQGGGMSKADALKHVKADLAEREAREAAFSRGEKPPVPVSAVENHMLELPTGYVREGNVYVYKSLPQYKRGTVSVGFGPRHMFNAI
jgi:hypothetical protein